MGDWLRMTWAGSVKPWIGNAVAWTGAGLVLLGGLVVALQALAWLQSGVWEPHPVEEVVRDLGYRQPYTRLLGLNQILDVVLGLPGSLSLVIVGMLVVLAGVQWADVPRDIRETLEARRIERTRRRLGLPE